MHSMFAPDINNRTTPNINNRTTPDNNNHTTPDINNRTTPDINNRTTPDIKNRTTPDNNNHTTLENNNRTTPDNNNHTTPDIYTMFTGSCAPDINILIPAYYYPRIPYNIKQQGQQGVGLGGPESTKLVRKDDVIYQLRLQVANLEQDLEVYQRFLLIPASPI